MKDRTLESICATCGTTNLAGGNAEDGYWCAAHEPRPYTKVDRFFLAHLKNLLTLIIPKCTYPTCAKPAFFRITNVNKSGIAQHERLSCDDHAKGATGTVFQLVHAQSLREVLGYLKG